MASAQSLAAVISSTIFFLFFFWKSLAYPPLFQSASSASIQGKAGHAVFLAGNSGCDEDGDGDAGFDHGSGGDQRFDWRSEVTMHHINSPLLRHLLMVVYCCVEFTNGLRLFDRQWRYGEFNMQILLPLVLLVQIQKVTVYVVK
ncbi:uncharacterized protein [Lolium perenne]|uniref:uncharacterized protein n=1 Tax=Lolium perenne TaxID=4522 RepID=UPI003A9919F8